MTIELFRPMLSASLPCTKANMPSEEEVIRDLKKLDWSEGFMCSPKIDGIRAIKHPTYGLVSRTLKPIPNKHIQACIDDKRWNYLDGELVVGLAEDFVHFNDNQSAIMSEGGTPKFTFNVFDHIERPNYRFDVRYGATQATIKNSEYVKVVSQVLIKNVDDLLEYEQAQVVMGYEGIILRHPARAYKNNRATWREMGMIKLKRFIDAEGEIIGFEELERNTNTATVDARGYTERSDHKSGMVKAGTLGLLKLRILNGEFEGKECGCGSGLDDSLRLTIWQNREEYLGRIVKFKYQPHGSQDKPRSPIFLGFRSREDM